MKNTSKSYCLFVLLSILFIMTNSSAKERILLFESTIEIKDYSWLYVTERIVVNIEYKKINHGIYRDFQIKYKNEEMPVEFIVDNVMLDDETIDYSISDQSDNKRIYCGSSEDVAPFGIHTYTIKYRTAPHCAFLDSTDELYWNVTGNNWEFPIDTVRASVVLPQPVQSKKLTTSAFTGPLGSKASKCRIVKKKDGASFYSLTRFKPGEGMTIDVRWPKGIITEPPKVKINSYNTDIKLLDGNEASITETISMTTNMFEIKEGIQRKLYTRYDTIWAGLRKGIFTDSEKTFLDGKEVTLRTEDYGIFVGDDSLKNGRHTFVFTYKTYPVVKTIAGKDILEWPVFSPFDIVLPIDTVQTCIEFPPGISPDLLDASVKAKTGFSSNITHNNNTSVVTFFNTAAFNSKDSVTYTVTLPSGHLKVMPFSKKLTIFKNANTKVFNGICAIVGSFIICFILWCIWGRDPKKGVIIPQFSPPEKLSAAATCYLTKKNYNETVFTLAILGLAAKGMIQIKETDDNGKNLYILIKKSPATPESCSEDELAVYNTLFMDKRSSIPLNSKNGDSIGMAMNDHVDSLKESYNNTYFLQNKWFCIVSFLLIILSISTTAGGSYGLGLGVLGLLIGVIVSLRLFDVVSKRLFFRELILIWLPLSIGFLVTLGQAFEYTPGLIYGLIGIQFIVPILFTKLMDKPVRSARKVYDHLEGFKLYLTIAEKDRLNALNPPENTPEVFEKYLPYAMALGVDQKWCEKFASVFDNIVKYPSGPGVSWYSSVKEHRSLYSLNDKLKSSFHRDVNTSIMSYKSAYEPSLFFSSGSSGSYRSSSFSSGSYSSSRSSSSGGSRSSGSSGSSGGGRGSSGGGGW